MGQARKAVELCSEALEKPPFKPALWINFALAKGAVGDASGQRELLAKLRAHLPEFFVDAAKAARSTQAPKVLEAALSMLRGNRSSWMYLYTLPDGTLKHERLAGIKPEEAPQDLSKNLWMFRTETPALEKELAAWRRR
jgi:hypothetical protein